MTCSLTITVYAFSLRQKGFKSDRGQSIAMAATNDLIMIEMDEAAGDLVQASPIQLCFQLK